MRYIAAQFARKQPVGTIKSIAGDHLEPTWGDYDKADKIIVGFQLSNATVLQSALGTAVSIKDLQICRNACAHLSSDRILDVKAARVRYDDTRFNHPSDMMHWIEPITNDQLWRYWIDEMRSAAQQALL